MPENQGSGDYLQTFTTVFSHPVRIKLLAFIAENPATRTEVMARELGEPRSSLGRHLRVFELHSLAVCDIPHEHRARRSGRWSVDEDQLRAVLAAFDEVKPKV